MCAAHELEYPHLDTNHESMHPHASIGFVTTRPRCLMRTRWGEGRGRKWGGGGPREEKRKDVGSVGSGIACHMGWEQHYSCCWDCPWHVSEEEASSPPRPLHASLPALSLSLFPYYTLSLFITSFHFPIIILFSHSHLLTPFSLSVTQTNFPSYTLININNSTSYLKKII